ncbi:DUF4286 family protein [Arvimicrobium flavum]|uniref:DUF4286 family protein n=1 Tax=Arvimicrobium flavum TaxID=3393320 RepID=UPI00237AF9A4|nr:DUF4286 family protein [Mesorhizobium shangrilense]
MPKYLFFGFTNPVPGREDEYNDWYTETHLPDLLKVPGIVSAQRFKLADHQRSPGPHPYKYLAVYECETDDVRSIVSELKARSGTSEMPISSAMDTERLMYFFEPITDVKSTEA